MDSFELWTTETFSYLSPEAKENMRIGYVAGLRRAAEIASEHNCPNAWNKIEREATRLESDKG